MSREIDYPTPYIHFNHIACQQQFKRLMIFLKGFLLVIARWGK